MLGKYSLYACMKEFQANRPLIRAYLNGDNIENFDGANNTEKKGKFFNLSIGLFLLIFIINIALFIWCIVAMVKFWHEIPNWAKVVSIILLIFHMTPISLLIIYLSRGKGSKNSGFRFY
jgi:uncharacterized protein YqhQ